MSRDTLITIYGVVAVSFMMTMYALERRHPAVSRREIGRLTMGPCCEGAVH
jgi:hypothetical protein